MFFGKSVEDDEVLPIALQACRGWFLATSAEPCAQTIAQTLTLLARGRLRERCQLRADLLVQPLGQLVEHVQSAVNPWTNNLMERADGPPRTELQRHSLGATYR